MVLGKLDVRRVDAWIGAAGIPASVEAWSIETMTEFENQLYSVEWKLPFTSVRQMTCYGALQETATYLGYKLLRERAIAAGDRVLETIFSLIGAQSSPRRILSKPDHHRHGARPLWHGRRYGLRHSPLQDARRWTSAELPRKAAGGGPAE